MRCTCGHLDDYNYAMDNGLCNSCIAEKLDQLETENKRLRDGILAIHDEALGEGSFAIATMCLKALKEVKR